MQTSHFILVFTYENRNLEAVFVAHTPRPFSALGRENKGMRFILGAAASVHLGTGHLEGAA